MRPLEGVTVVSLEQAVAAPFATRQLADLGARVVKIERPGTGDFARGYDQTVRGMSSHFVWLNRSKESVALDLKHPAALEALHRLLAMADVFVQNLAPGAAARLGLEGQQLLAQYPELIVCDISGYGSSGPYRDKKAYDLLIQCEAGLVSITGTDDTPSKVGISIADISAGVYAYTGILTALYSRERTGKGAVLEVSLFDALAEWMSYPAYFTAYGGTPPPRAGASHATIAPYGPFDTADGLQVNLGIQNEREWNRFCVDVLGRPDLVQDARFASNWKRVENRAALDDAINAIFRTLPMAEVIERLDRAGIANARMNTMHEFLEHPQLSTRDRWREVGSPVGTLRALRPPVTIQGVEERMDPVPALGEHTRSVLVVLGYGEDEVEHLLQEGAARADSREPRSSTRVEEQVSN